MSDEWFMAVDIIGDISLENPSLEEWTDLITDPKKLGDQTQSQNDSVFDVTAISGSIESLVSEIKNMQHWDPDHVGDIEWQLQEYQKILTSNQGSFESNVYQSLMNDINVALNKIGRFNNVFNSETTEGIKRI